MYARKVVESIVIIDSGQYEYVGEYILGSYVGGLWICGLGR